MASKREAMPRYTVTYVIEAPSRAHLLAVLAGVGYRHSATRIVRRKVSGRKAKARGRRG